MKYPYYPEPSTLLELYKDCASKYAKREMSGFADGSQTYTFESFKRAADELSDRLSTCGIGAGDRVAILSESCPQWMVAFMATAVFGRVAVPILPDCSAAEVSNILHHSASQVVFVSQRQKAKLGDLDTYRYVFDIADFSLIHSGEGKIPNEEAEHAAKAYKPGATAEPQPDTLATILYTSGTSGNSKGVMLSHRNLCANITIASHFVQVGKEEGDIFLSVLPMAHTYELSFGQLFCMSMGCKVCFIKGLPTPTLLKKAFMEVRPAVVCSVPLIIEKIVRKMAMPRIKNNAALRLMSKCMPHILYPLVGKKLIKSFGGRLRYFPIGGAKLDSEVEAFLKKAGFPYMIGYGMTECAPLICGAGLKEVSVGSTGHAAHNVQVKLYNPNPKTGQGEVVVKGPNVMLGYYKDPERTKEAFTEDGWLHTKDLAFLDKKGHFHICGRIGSMIVGSSGENIYPEEIEMIINGVDDVEDSLVKSDKNNRLVALVKLNDGVIDWSANVNILEEKMSEISKSIMTQVNSLVNKASQISSVILMKDPFEKTATRKIRRFLYN